MDRQAFDCIRLFASPFSNLEFLWCPPGLHSLLCDPMSDSLRYHYSARKGPRSSNVFHLFERFHNSAEILCVCQISFLLSFLNVHFMAVELNSTLYLFPPQSRNWDPFFSQQSACWSALYLAYNWRVQKFPLGFGHRIVKKCYVVNRGRNQWWKMLCHRCQNCLFISFLCGNRCKIGWYWSKVALRSSNIHSVNVSRSFGAFSEWDWIWDDAPYWKSPWAWLFLNSPTNWES